MNPDKEDLEGSNVSLDIQAELKEALADSPLVTTLYLAWIFVSARRSPRLECL